MSAGWSREAFSRDGDARWRRLAELTARGGRSLGIAAAQALEFVGLYRRTCGDLALAQHRGYGSRLCDRLNALALAAHHLLYGDGAQHGWRRLVDFAAFRFPQTVRSEWRAVAVAAAVFYVPFFATVGTVLAVPEAAYVLVDGATLGQMEEMHDASDPITADAGSGAAGFAAYLWHNGSIAFRTFAFGMLAGVGTLFVLLFNALVLGAVFGHLNAAGIGDGLNAFAIGHGAFELTAIVIAGAAGLRLGFALVAPGRRSRGDALRAAARPAASLVGGAGLFIAIAACIEAMWSPSDVPHSTKYLVGVGLWLAVIAYFALAGRSRRAP